MYILIVLDETIAQTYLISSCLSITIDHSGKNQGLLGNLIEQNNFMRPIY
ncbi:MAG: hypothetical protein AAF587_01675 [Bacteroidota bacterium]